jgi:hypothetical protein
VWVNAHTDARGRRSRFNNAGVLVLNTTPRLMLGALHLAAVHTHPHPQPRAGGSLRTSTRRSNDPTNTSTPHDLITCQHYGWSVIENKHSNLDRSMTHIECQCSYRRVEEREEIQHRLGV